MKIAISGGTGLVGTAITSQLVALGHQVTILTTRNKADTESIKYSQWKPEAGQLDQKVIDQADGIINLAGASISKRWTKKHKAAILSSRLDSTRLLADAIAKSGTAQIFVQASAIGYYGHSFELKTEEDGPGQGFMSEVCKSWEQAAAPIIQNPEVRTTILRIGVVLSRKGGALPQFAKPMRFGIGSPLGNGKQYLSTIHLEDVAAMFVAALTNDRYSGVYNAVDNKPQPQKEFLKRLARIMGKPFFFPAVPAFVLRLVLGEMAHVVLDSNKISNKKLAAIGFQYKYSEANEALDNLFSANRRT